MVNRTGYQAEEHFHDPISTHFWITLQAVFVLYVGIITLSTPSLLIQCSNDLSGIRKLRYLSLCAVMTMISVLYI